MAFKINVSHNGKTYKVETEDEKLVGKSIGDKIDGGEFSEELAGYEIEITGTSDKAGFAGHQEIDGPNLKKVLLGYGRGMHMKPKGLSKKPNVKPKGLRLRKTVRGKEISSFTVQINVKVLKEGVKKFEDLFVVAAPEGEAASAAEAPAESEGGEVKEEKAEKAEEKKGEVKEAKAEEKKVGEKKK